MGSVSLVCVRWHTPSLPFATGGAAVNTLLKNSTQHTAFDADVEHESVSQHKSCRKAKTAPYEDARARVDHGVDGHECARDGETIFRSAADRDPRQ